MVWERSKDSFHRPWRAARELFPDLQTIGCLAATLAYRGTRDVTDVVAADDDSRLRQLSKSNLVWRPHVYRRLRRLPRNSQCRLSTCQHRQSVSVASSKALFVQREAWV